MQVCSTQDNSRNQKIRSVNTSGVTGVSWRENRQSWRAYITIDGKQQSLGHFKNFDDAVVARLKAELKYFGEFAPQKHLYKEYDIIETN